MLLDFLQSLSLRLRHEQRHGQEIGDGRARERQEEARSIAAQVDAMVVVGGRQSGNTRRLADLAAQSGISTYHIEQAEELRAEDFAGKGRVGLTAGASTPRKLIDATQHWLEQLPD